MATGILGIKRGMTQAYDKAGTRFPLTVIEAGPCTVVQVKTDKNEGYNAIVVGFGERDLRKLTQPEAGVFKKALGEKTRTGFRTVREFRVDDPSAFKVGQVITVEQFNSGDLVDITGKSKGRGFAGTIKRHGFSRGPLTHGSKNKREPGSIGMSAYPGRVVKGKKMAGQLGNKKVTVQRLQIFQVDAEKNLLFVVGAVPGANSGLVTVKPSVKA
ncbi:MAG: 50S ribosomal protein L3 [Candidatus Lernaella stagnicola]|nr:50S ribosomal protein L3 [Candidatus Lernaella stagnicola]